ncbi:MAG: hypothetical protein FWF60_07685 [Oscillospiraceae bacterium]|nr:hypothetical protein [Oscillospiraceae bacterium]
MKNDVTQWVNLAMNAAAFVLFAAGVLAALLRLRRERQGAQEKELAAWDRADETLRALLNGSVYGLVTQAEHEFGAGQGEIKKSAVLAQLLRLIPEQWRARFDADTLGALIENGLRRAKAVWAKQR